MYLAPTTGIGPTVPVMRSGPNQTIAPSTVQNMARGQYPKVLRRVVINLSRGGTPLPCGEIEATLPIQFQLLMVGVYYEELNLFLVLYQPSLVFLCENTFTNNIVDNRLQFGFFEGGLTFIQSHHEQRRPNELAGRTNYVRPCGFIRAEVGGRRVGAHVTKV